MALPDTGEKPPHVIAAELAKQEALSTAGVTTTPAASRPKSWEMEPVNQQPVPVLFPLQEPHMQIPQAVAVQPVLGTHEIILEHENFQLTFMALEVSERNYQVAIRLPKDAGFSFEPKIDSSYRLIYDDHQYTAIFMGGIFEFPSDNSITIAFMVENKEPYGKERTNRSREDSSRESAGG